MNARISNSLAIKQCSANVYGENGKNLLLMEIFCIAILAQKYMYIASLRFTMETKFTFFIESY